LFDRYELKLIDFLDKPVVVTMKICRVYMVIVIIPILKSIYIYRTSLLWVSCRATTYMSHTTPRIMFYSSIARTPLTCIVNINAVVVATAMC